MTAAARLTTAATKMPLSTDLKRDDVDPDDPTPDMLFLLIISFLLPMQKTD